MQPSGFFCSASQRACCTHFNRPWHAFFCDFVFYSPPNTLPDGIGEDGAAYGKKKPRVLLAMGGICVPLSVIAWMMRIPVISFEQNAIPGRSTRLIQFFSSTIVTAFECASESLSKIHCGALGTQ